ncbi:MAG: hypothetical protein CMJ27_05415 [Phycisphaerae bacterium]|nr:hypothetical protein [Phycisphaerae bacterium]OUX02116.1 MAG: hypothetical protein CBD91_03240 [Phycisphaeraceae bacterium TMED231]
MRRLTAIILPFSLALASGAFATSSSDAVDRSPSTSEVGTPTAARSTVRPTTPPDTARRRSLSPEQRRAIADRLDRMTPRMRQALLGRLAKMSDAGEGDRPVRRAGPITRRADENGNRRELRDRRSRRGSTDRSRSMSDRSRRGVDRSDAATPMRGKADGLRDRRDREGVRGSKNHRRSANRKAGDDARDRGDARRVRMGKRAHGIHRQTDEVRRARDHDPRLRRAADPRPKASSHDPKRFSPSERRRRD